MTSILPGCRPNEKADQSLVYDWNKVARTGRVIPNGVEFFDETLRDGLQNPSVKDPDIADKLELVQLMDKLGIHVADIGLPGSSARAFEDCLRICQEITSSKLKIKVATAGRTVASDLTPMIDLSQRAGIPVEVYAFLGSSPIRGLAEDWDLSRLKKMTKEAIEVSVKGGLEVCFVTEDTTRSRPEMLSELFKVAIDAGASALCLCDTVGHATPDGVRNLIRFARGVTMSMGRADVRIDWHGHNDRGLALVNSILALEVGADRVHGTALGIGERVGNAQMELIPAESQAARSARRSGPDSSARVLPAHSQGRRLGCADQLPAGGRRRVPHGDGGARRRHHQGEDKR